MANVMLKGPETWFWFIFTSVGRTGEINQEAGKAILNASP